MDSWKRMEALVGAIAPTGLRPPATAADLEALDIPPDWRHLWAAHDGQSSDVAGLFQGWHFLPLRGGDSVEAESDDDWLVVAKDFGGGTWAIAKTGGPLVESLDGETRLVARNFIDLLDKMADALEQKSPTVEKTPRERPARPTTVRRTAEPEVTGPAQIRPAPAAAPAPLKVMAPSAPAVTEPDDVLSAIAMPSVDGWSADVHAGLEHAGGLVEVDFNGERRAVRLPPTLRDGMKGTFEGATPDGARLRIHVHLRAKMPATPQETS